MDLHFEGAVRLDAGKQAIFEQLTDPRRMVDTIPGREEARVIDGASVEARVKVNLPEIEGPLRVELAVAEADPQSGAKLVTKGEGDRFSLKITSSFELLGDGPTWMHWTADAELDGALADLDRDQLKNLADREAEEVIGELTRAV